MAAPEQPAPEQPTPEQPPQRGGGRSRWKLGLGGVGIAFILVTFLFFLPKIADYRDVWDVVKELSWQWVLALIAVDGAQHRDLRAALAGGAARPRASVQALEDHPVLDGALDRRPGWRGGRMRPVRSGCCAAGGSEARDRDPRGHADEPLEPVPRTSSFPIIAVFLLAVTRRRHEALLATAGVHRRGDARRRGHRVRASCSYSDRLARDIGDAGGAGRRLGASQRCTAARSPGTARASSGSATTRSTCLAAAGTCSRSRRSSAA